ncbi:MAG: hypothetical protein JHC73_13205 [Dolichospermum sp.]|jgi:hypothetical protein|nr:hypothetical protein [Dolichospermum sp.]
MKTAAAITAIILNYTIRNNLSLYCTSWAIAVMSLIFHFGIEFSFNFANTQKIGIVYPILTNQKH